MCTTDDATTRVPDGPPDSPTRYEPRPSHRRRTLRTVWRNQLRLWDRVTDDLQPWRQEGPLRWRGRRLDGVDLDGRDGPSQQGDS